MEGFTDGEDAIEDGDRGPRHVRGDQGAVPADRHLTGGVLPPIGAQLHLSLPMFYAAPRGDAGAGGTERAIDMSLLHFKDWLDSARGRKAVRENPGVLLKLARRQAVELGETLKRLGGLLEG